MWRPIDPLTDPRWGALVSSHPRAAVFHTEAWLQALKRTYAYTPIAFTTSAPHEPLHNAILFCRVESWATGRRLVSLPFSDHCEPLVSGARELNTFVAALDRIAAGERARYIELRPVALPAGTAGMRPHQTFWFHEIDLTPSLETLTRNLHRDSVYRKIGRAKREGVVCETGSSEALLDAFWRLFLMTRRRHVTPPPPRSWFRNVLDCLGPAAAIRVAFHGKEAIAAVLTLRSNRTMIYKYGCSDASRHPLGAMPFLQWTAIEAAKQEGLASFDLGRSDLNAEGLITFKDRLGASKSLLTYFRFPGAPALAAASDANGRSTARLKRAVVSRLPDTLFTSLGALLYRHLG